MRVLIPYTVVCDQKQNYLCFIDNNSLAKLPLPIEVKDEISSFGISFKTSVYVNNNSNQLLTSKEKTELLCLKVSELIQKVWKWEFGIPIFQFQGAIKAFDKSIVNSQIYILQLLNDVSVKEQLTAWSNLIRFATKFVFYAEPCKECNSYNFISTEHQAVNTYLQVRLASLRGTKANFERYNLEKIMNDWYGDREFCANLRQAAQDVVNEFLLAKSLDIYIPGFMVTAVYHIKHYKRAQEIITAKYDPSFVMTLPLIYDNKSYTVHFPILHKVC